jgi:hypothetical protein
MVRFVPLLLIKQLCPKTHQHVGAECGGLLYEIGDLFWIEITQGLKKQVTIFFYSLLNPLRLFDLKLRGYGLAGVLVASLPAR